MKFSDIALIFIWLSICADHNYNGWVIAGPFVTYFVWRFIDGVIQGWKYAKAQDANRP